ncbi:MAG TPA: NAD(P)/FAD-dependent oxidoreductase, partial [Nitrospiraceae bacterium]|nr:NAD(P)/FAD-dependent oxidoreductase [Nitrospiraceae bacterium]
EGANGERFIVYTDIDRLEGHMKKIAPQDSSVIDEFIKALRTCTRLDPPWEKAPEVSGLFDLLKLIVKHFPLLRMLWKWNKVSLQDFGMRFRHPLIRKAFPLLFTPDISMPFILMNLAWLHRKSAGYPRGGSLEFSRAIEQRYCSLGGEINYKARVAKILTDNGSTVGIRLEDGSEHYADYVISAADGHATIFEMLDGKYVDETIHGYYKNLLPFPSSVHVSLGVNRTFDDIPPLVMGMLFALDETMEVGGVQREFLKVYMHNFDSSLAPPGKTVMHLFMTTDYDFWTALRHNPERYAAEKEKIADQVVAILDKRFPGLAGQVEMRDVATPTTYVRYTGNWKGSDKGWLVTPATWQYGRAMQKTLPGLRNFLMAGHWVVPGGGIPTAAMSGRHAIQILCKQEKKKFLTTV